MNAPKRHHIVPQFYMKRFAQNDLVEVVARDDFSKVFQTGTANALVEKQFYTMESSTTGPDLWVEQELFAKGIERNGCRAICRVIDERISLSRPALLSGLAFFVVFQFVRGQGTRQPMVEAHKATARMIAKLMTPEMAKNHIRNTEGREPSDEEVHDLLEFAKSSDQYEVEITHQNNLHIRFMADIAPLAIPLSKMNWRILDFPEPLLITGDEPIGLVGASRVPGEGIGLLTASEVVFPTDPRHAIVITREGRDRYSRGEGTPEMADLINRHIAFRCHRYLLRMPGTVPTLAGMVLPEKAPMVSVVENMIVSRVGMSKEEAAKDLAKRQARRRMRTQTGRRAKK